MKKLISIVLVVAMMAAMAVAFTGCGGVQVGVDDGKFTVFGYSYENSPDKKEVYEYYHKLWQEKSEKPIEWIGGDIQMIMSSGDYPDIILKTQFQNVDVAKYASQGVLLPLEDYITEENTPNIWKMFQEQPTTKAIATSPDGHIYALPSYGGGKAQFIETYFWINKVWLDKLGLEVPTTLAELKEVLKAFKTGDPNGNGKADEIPMTFYNEGAYTYPETLLSAWGVSTKFGMYDAYLNVQNGQVNFTPMMDEWKEMIKFYAELYKEGLLDVQCFTYESNTYGSTVRSETPVVGFAFGKEAPFGDNTDQYLAIAPFSADGKIKPVLHIHPGAIGARNAVHVTANCEDPKAAMAWIDTFYDHDATITNWYGQVSGTTNGAIKETFTKDGEMYKWNDYEAQGHTSLSEMYYRNSTYGPHMPGYMNLEEDRGVTLEDNVNFQTYDEIWALYEPYIDQETWPRPYYSPEDSNRLGVLQTDIFNVVEQNKANWIMGRSDVEADWDNYIKQLKTLGADEFLEINQRTYDVYQEAIDSIK